MHQYFISSHMTFVKHFRIVCFSKSCLHFDFWSKWESLSSRCFGRWRQCDLLSSGQQRRPTNGFERRFALSRRFASASLRDARAPTRCESRCTDKRAQTLSLPSHIAPLRSQSGACQSLVRRFGWLAIAARTNRSTLQFSSIEKKHG